MKQVFIDGSAGTTGLRIVERLSARDDLSLIILPDDKRKDPAARKEALHKADIAFLCLPDAAAIEAVALAEGSDCVIIDTSTAHRTNEGWAYGFPELSGRKEKILSSKRIANPGCHASGFVALVEPLVQAGLLPADAALCCFSLTGYSGGGKNMIAEYESADRDALLTAPRQYGITQQHKHLKEMAKIAGLNTLPVFSPIVAPFYSGMEVTIPLFTHQLRCEKKDAIAAISEVYKNTFRGPIVHYNDSASENGFLSAGAFSGKDTMEVSVFGNEDRIILVSRFDNLGKGASGAAIQNMNLILGVDETTGLTI
ncbi:MAG: N-acetyl-gamma-glutamyl-phosphate reductase [Clostridia bacterium]|nr:N-acetyl-gamma-glutamyl-phosphate reductase [Clostridia bacterium]